MSRAIATSVAAASVEATVFNTGAPARAVAARPAIMTVPVALPRNVRRASGTFLLINRIDNLSILMLLCVGI